MKFDKKIIGVLGGMGPNATVDFYSKIVRTCQQKFGASSDGDFPPMVIFNAPVPDACESLEDREKILTMLKECVTKLENFGVDFIVIPCNTAHYFLPSLRESASVPILSIIEETLKKIKKEKYKKVGLLATTTTIGERLYEKSADKYNIELIKPEKTAQDKIMRIIRNVTAGKTKDIDKKELVRIVKDLDSNGAEAIILGCTELPLIFDKTDFKIDIFDTSEILAEAAVKKSYGE